MYEWWRGVFYPEDIPKSRWFDFYQKNFNTVELNVTFYRLPQKTAFESWRKKAKKGFVFSLKGSRFITHVKRIKDIEDSLNLFMDRAKILGETLGPILWQFPPQMKVDEKRFENFLNLLKRTSHKLHVIELRNREWLRKDIFNEVKRYGFTVCVSDHPECSVEEISDMPFLYIRRHGKGILYGGSYTKKDLLRDAELIKSYKGKDAFIYFNNDQNAYAALNALELMKMLS
jgi:uncharacterized protein YecE (DUF72 family)